MARENLTDRRLKALKPAPAGKRIEIFDAQVPSMCVRVTDKGKKTFALVARYNGSDFPTRRALGSYPALSLEAARNKARDWLDLLGQGKDPKEEAAKQQAERTRAATAKDRLAFENVLEKYIAARERDGIKKVSEDRRDFERECLPVWKGRSVDEIRMNDILAVVEAIRDRGHQRQALNMAQKIGTFFGHCVDDEIIEVTPYRPKRITRNIGKKQSRDRVLSDNEIRAFWAATDELGVVYRDIYRLLLLTGQRLNDIAKASWDEIDAKARTLTVTAERFKSARDHVVPLTDDAWNIIEGAPRWDRCTWVFSLDGRRPVTIGDKVKKRLDAAMVERLRAITGEPDAEIEPWVNHDLRRTVRTHLTELNVSDVVAEAVIGHASDALNQTYNLSQRTKQKMDALNRWQGALRTITGQPQPDNIVDLKARA